MDIEASTQLRETRETILDALRTDPDNFRALLIADVLVDIEPDDALAPHRTRFRATRADDWRVEAKRLGLDNLLWHLANGWRESGIGATAIPVLERRAADIGEARAHGTIAGLIDASCVPPILVADPRVKIDYHANGHLARVTIRIDARHEGELELAETPGSGHFRLLMERGGYGTMINENYRNGAVVTTLNTPWHDGEESISKHAWTRWVEENLAELARLRSLPVRVKEKTGRVRRRRR